MAKNLRFDDQVVIVTGGGNGLGRAHALLFGRRGAKVVVNDLGGGATGAGNDKAAADLVVDEIRAAGGEAVANYDSVEMGDRIVQTAIDTYGRVDVVVNNAGILRDKSFHKMNDDDWQTIFVVHVLGAFRVTHAAWPYFREQGYGRVIMTSSAAGIYGNFGQANYSAAKLGLVGFANTLAIEGRKRNIHVNTIAPLAASRLTKGIVPDSIFDAVQPDLVSPLVAYLCHASCDETGGLFEVGGGLFSKLRWERADGKMFRLGREITPEAVAGAWPEVTDFDQSHHPADIASSMGPLVDNINAGASLGGNQYIDVDEALGAEVTPFRTEHDERDIALYAIGVGSGADPLDEKGLQLVYERHGSGFYVLPTFTAAQAVSGIIRHAAEQGTLAPGLNFGLDRLLHGEQTTEILLPVPANAELTHHSRVTDIYDKGKGALVVIETSSKDGDGDVVVKNRLTAFIRGAGGWGGDRGAAGQSNIPPDRKPDAVIHQQTTPDQAILYRLSGDWNPLHVDPGFAQAFGFDRPILHGMCTYGFAVRHVAEAFCNGDPRYVRKIEARFAKSVIPGETITTEMWQESATRIVFQCKVAERDSLVISNAVVELFEDLPKKTARSQEKETVAEAEAVNPDPSSAALFGAVQAYLVENPDLVSQVGKTYQFSLQDPDSAWSLDLKNEAGSVAEGPMDKPDCTIAMSDADFVAMALGKSDAMKLYMDGKMQISGDLMASQKLEFLKKVPPPEPRSGGEPAPVSPAKPAAAPAVKEPKAPQIFGRLAEMLAADSSLLEGSEGVLQFHVLEPKGSWVIDLANGGSVKSGTNSAANATFTMSDAALEGLVGGSQPQQMFQRGTLQVEGDLFLARKLTVFHGLA